MAASFGAARPASSGAPLNTQPSTLNLFLPVLYRSLAAVIVIFWIAMSALLLRSELGPSDSRLRAVPAGHVMKLLFAHEQTSDLNIYSDRQRIGHLRLHPRVRKEDGARVLEFSGRFQLTLPGTAPWRVAWDGSMEMTRLLDVQSFHLGLTLRDLGNSRLELTFLPPENLARYELWNAGVVVDKADFPLDERGAQAVVDRLGIPPDIFRMARGSKSAKPAEITALQSSIEIHGEKIDTYLVTIRQNGQTMIEVHVSQLGQVLRGTTLLGYTFSPDELMP